MLLRATMQVLLAAVRAQGLARLFRALLACALASCRSQRQWITFLAPRGLGSRRVHSVPLELDERF
jgi:hypothetical protein